MEDAIESKLNDLNVGNIDLDMELISMMVQSEDDLIQDSFNEDNVMGNYDEDGSLDMEGVENA